MPSILRPHWLCIAYAFPPINRSGTHRTLGFVSHLDRLGWDATVLTVDPTGEALDESLLKRIPASATVLRTPWVDPIERIKSVRHLGLRSIHLSRRPLDQSVQSSNPPPERQDPTQRQSTRNAPNAKSRPAPRGIRDWVSRTLMTPDSRIGWITPAMRAGLEAIRQRRPSVIYSTSPYMSAHLIALLLSRRTRIPWVADFRDPWRGNPFRRLAYASLEHWDAWLERVVLGHAAHIVCNTPTMMNDLCRRVPSVTGKCTTILNGFDAESYDGIAPVRIAPVEDFVLTHCGQFYGSRSPKVWFSALKRVIEQSPRPARRIHLVLIGLETFDGQLLRDLAAEAGVADCVRILGVKTHRETLSHMTGSDALILAGSTGVRNELQIPNKLFEYLPMRKPIIATLPRGNPGVSVFEQARAVAYVCGPDDEEGIATAVERFAGGLYNESQDAWTGVEQFERSHRASELVQIFERIRRRPAGCHARCPGGHVRMLSVHEPETRVAHPRKAWACHAE